MNDVRKTRPTAGNKYYIRRANGGYSGCIQGSPTDSQCNVLANCVGYANGGINEEKGEGREVYPLTCNAENFIERGIAYGLSVYKSPEVGDCIVWQKGATLSGNDGAGHVAIVTDVLDRNADGTAKTIITSESGYGSSNPFWRTKRTNANGKWGAGSGYSFRGCLRIPGYKPTPTPTPQPTPSDKFNIGDDVVLNGPIYVSSNASSPANTIKNKVTKVTRKNPGSAHPYNTTGDLGWCDESSLSKYTPAPTPAPEPPKPQPTPVGPKFAVGQKVRINIKSSGYAASADGTGQGGRRYKVANGWVRLVLKYHSGKPFPYQVGNATGTTGFFKEEDLQSI